MDEYGSRKTASAAISLALTMTHEEEKAYTEQLCKQGFRAVAVDYGGEFEHSIIKIVERAVAGAKRCGLIAQTHAEEGAVAGATRDAISQITAKAVGMNIGGKVAVARYEDNICVCVFCTIGLLHLNEVAIGLGHRVI